MKKLSFKLSSKLLIIIGSIASISVGIHFINLTINSTIFEIPHFVMGLIALGIGFWALFSYLDNMYVIIYDGQIELKSIFKKE